MIGGSDIAFWVRDDLPAADIIIRVLRRHWPEFVFQDADDPDPPKRWASFRLPEPAGHEFMLYKDEKAALSWEEHGAIPENRNTLLYVILGTQHRHNERSLTMVCTELAGEMATIIQEIEDAFVDAATGCRFLPEAA